jgi:hypothetical protein
MRPTEEAHDSFNMAIFEANKIKRGPASDPIAAAVVQIALGLSSMNDGLRATYILLEQLKKEVDAIKANRS